MENPDKSVKIRYATWSRLAHGKADTGRLINELADEAINAWLDYQAQASQTPDDSPAQDVIDHPTGTPAPAPFACNPENIAYHHQLEKILGDPEERGGIEANLRWGAGEVERKPNPPSKRRRAAGTK